MLDWLHLRRPGGRLVIWLVVAVALASIATGVGAILTRPAVAAGGALGDLQSAAEFSGSIVGFALLVAAWGMRRGYRLAYVAAVALVALSAAHGVVQFRALSIPLVVLSVGVVVVLAATSERFTRSSALDATQVGSLLGIVGVLCYGTAGAYALRAQFDGVESVVDAVYFTVVTASTVGYGDVHASTETARLFAISLVVLGPTTVAAAVGSLFGSAVETRFARAGHRATTHLRSDGAGERGARDGTPNRIAVVGVSATLEPILEALAKRASVTVVTGDESPSRVPDGADSIVGDPTDARTLEVAELDEADSVLVGTGAGDTDPGELIAAVRSHADARIVVVVGGDGDSRDDRTLERAGADVVLDPEVVLVEATLGALLESDGAAGQSSTSAASQRG